MGGLLQKAVSLLVAVGAVFIAVLHHFNYISVGQFLFAEITLVLAVAALLLPRGGGGEMPVLRLPFPLWILPAVVYLVGQVEMFLLRHTSLLYLLTLAGALVLTAFSHEKPVKKLAVAIATIGVSHALLYSQYIPSFGNDTWRDAIWAMQTLQTGHITEATVRHSAYPFPMVPLTYTAISLASGLDPLWSSVVAGFLYLIQLPLLTLLLTRRLVGADDCRGALFLLMTPLAVIWSAWYIPQVYSLTIFLTALLAQSSALRYLLLATGVFGHGGVATWMLLNTLVLWIATREKEVGRALIYLITVFITYATYTTVIYGLVGGYRNVFEATLTFLRGERHLVAVAPVPKPPTVSLGNLTFSVLGVMGLLVFLHGKGALKTLAFLSSFLLVTSYVMQSTFKGGDLVRYMGLPSLILLAIIAPYGLNLLRESRYGNIYISTLIVIAITSFVYSGIFAPGNSYTINTTFGYSIYNVLNINEVSQILLVLQRLSMGYYFTDWLSGAYIWYHHQSVTEIYPYRGFKCGDVEFILGGIFGGIYGTPYWVLDVSFWERFDGTILLREGHIDPSYLETLAKAKLEFANKSIMFNGEHIKLFKIVR